MKKKVLLVLGIVFTVLFVAAMVLTVYIGGNTALVSDTGIKTGQQNNIIGYDDTNDILFVGTRTGSLLAFNNATREQLWEVKNEAGQPFTDIDVNAANGQVFVGSDDQNIYKVDIQTGEVLDTYNIQRRVLKLDVSADGSRMTLLSRTNNNYYVVLYDTVKGEQLSSVKYTYKIKGVLFSQDEQSVVVADGRGRISRLDENGEEVLKPVSVLDLEIVQMHRAGDGNYFAMDKQGRYMVCDEDGNVLRKGAASMIQGAEVTSGGIDASGNVLIGTKQGYVYVLNADEKQIYDYRQAGGFTVSDFMADGTMMYSTGYGNFVDSIELASLETIAVLRSMASVIQLVTILAAVAAAVFFILYFPASCRILFKIGRALWKHKIAYLLLIPTFTLLIFFNYTPMVIALSRAFTNWSAKRSTAADFEFVGLYNFKRMFTEGYFLIGVKNMLILMITGFIKSLTMPILTAWLVYSFGSDRQKYIYRFLFVLPIVVPGLVGSLLWKEIYNPGGGLDQILTALGHPEWIHVWLGEAKIAIWSIVFMGPPYIGAMPFLLYYGGFTSIDSSLYEAAKIDGASRWRIFWKIQLPLVRPQMKLLIMLQFIGSIQDYGGIYLLTQGGPGTATYVPGLELYYNATTFGNYGYACAMGLVMFIIIMIGTFFNNKIKAENYNS